MAEIQNNDQAIKCKKGEFVIVNFIVKNASQVNWPKDVTLKNLIPDSPCKVEQQQISLEVAPGAYLDIYIAVQVPGKAQAYPLAISFFSEAFKDFGQPMVAVLEVEQEEASPEENLGVTTLYEKAMVLAD